MKKLLLLVLILPFLGLAQEKCWSFNTVEKGGNVGYTANSDLCISGNKDITVNLEGEKFTFKYISHKNEVFEGEKALVVKTHLSEDIFYISFFDDNLGVLVTDIELNYSTWFYNE